MFFVLNLLGIFVFLAIGILFSKRRREIKWRSVEILLLVNVFLAWFMLQFSVGRDMVMAVAAAFAWMMDAAYDGIAFAFADWVKPDVGQMNFFAAVLLPILLIVPIFDVLTYLGILPFVVRWIGRGLSFLTRQPKFESFYAIGMMFLGSVQTLAVSRLQLRRIKADRNLTLAMMSMSSISAALVGVYIGLMPAQYVLAAIPLNIVNALLVTGILHPVRISTEEDIVAQLDDAWKEREPFFAFLSNSIIGAGRLILIVTATVIAFVAFIALIDKLLMLVHASLTLESMLGYIMFPFAYLLGLSSGEAFQMAQYMGTKLIANEIVVMVTARDLMVSFTPHMQCVLTVFSTSFANFGTLALIIGAFKGIADEGRNELVARNVGYMMLSGVLVSLLSAAIAGLFVW